MNKWDVALGALEDARLALNAIPIPRWGRRSVARSSLQSGPSTGRRGASGWQPSTSPLAARSWRTSTN